MLVGDLEELVEVALQEVAQPLNQVGPNTPYCSPVHTLVPSPPHSPPRLMVGVNANQPLNTKSATCLEGQITLELNTSVA